MAGQDAFMDRYHEALKSEIRRYAVFFGKQSIKTVYFGGGTPSTYPANLLLDMFGTLKSVFNFDNVQEVTIEVNPGAVQARCPEIWRAIGINRVSIGVQSTDEEILRGLNRFQTNADLFWLLDACAQHFENVSVDLMIGLPGVNECKWQDFLKEVVSWPIKHVSIYCLMVHEQTPLYFKILKNEMVMPSEELVTQLYTWTVEYLQQNGFFQYEVSNFARVGYESLHNRCYWERFPYRGFGLSSCSFDGRARFQNDSNLMSYLKKIENEQDAVVFNEYLSDEEIRLEQIMLGLRCAHGISLTFLLRGISELKQQLIKQKIANFVRDGLVLIKDDRICLTTVGLAVENEVITQLSI